VSGVGGAAPELLTPSGGAATIVPTGPEGSSGGGVSCDYTWETHSWQDQCSARSRCLDLDPAISSVVTEDPHPADGGFGPGETEAAFCTPPDSSVTYTFAADVDGPVVHTGYNVYTGDQACEGRELAYLGITPLARYRTLCFSIPGRYLASRLAVIPNSTDVDVTNLRRVTSCPCAYPLPYNITSTCPSPPQGAAGNPGCG
jgi:hypothetical protein